MIKYEQDVTATKRGKRAEAQRIKYFAKLHLGKYLVGAITAEMIASWRDYRLTKVSPGTVLRELQLLGHVFGVAIREWSIGLQNNPVAAIGKPKPGRPRDRVLTNTERYVLLIACGKCQNLGSSL